MCWGDRQYFAEDRTQGLGACNTTELYPSPQSLYCGLKTQVRCIHLTTSWTSQSIRLPARIISSLFSYSAKQYLCIDFSLKWKHSSTICPAQSHMQLFVQCLLGKKAFLWLPMSKGSDPGHDQFYFTLQPIWYYIMHIYASLYLVPSLTKENALFLLWIRT